MSLAPVVLFVYNRPDFAEKNLRALNDNKEASDSKLYIFSDGAKNESAVDAVAETRKVIRDFCGYSRFREVEIIEQPKNKGLARSIIEGVTSIISKHGKVIVIEDDCIVSPYFLRYMNEGLLFYENDMSVGSISGWTPNLYFPPDFNAEQFAILRSCSYCWATWDNRWKNVDWDMKDFDNMRYDWRLISRSGKTGTDRFVRFIRQKKFNVQSWSIRFGMSLVKNNQSTIYPRFSYAENIGSDSRGTHYSAKKLAVPFLVKSDRAPKSMSFLPASQIQAGKTIEKQFARIYGGTLLHRIKNRVYIYGGDKLLDSWRK